MLTVYAVRHKETGKFPYKRQVAFREFKDVLRDAPAKVFMTWNHAKSSVPDAVTFEIVKYEMVEIHE